ncbi:acetylxylan esterase [Mucilaginibacter sp. HMF5004]|uniref:alpha/beta hydrolase family protein n=1 Tax=Mucilaginibacter rivuli TaxID=2857527 RepID=UPI001C60761A|nr:CocE/NonD family hydrolase [Mucilaginibacter rivuli]MBW4890569.1 acetylxylan esterase [Mucilaginibacter rivuli]
MSRYKLTLSLLLLFSARALFAQEQYPAPAKVVADFKKIVDRPRVAPKPSFQTTVTDSVIIETGSIYTEKDEQVPLIIYKPVTQGAKAFPVVIFMHGTGGKKEDKDVKSVLLALVKRGIMGVSIDARFHGARIPGGAHGSKEYVDAVTAAWHNTDPAKQTHLFFWDTVYDLWRLTDYLVTRPDVQANRIGMGGISMGGIQAWMAAATDSRIKVVAPDIAAQSFKWSLENNRWQGRAHTIQAAQLQAAKDLGDTALNQRNVKALWDKVVPGITDEFDCPSMLRLIAPRPLLILSTEKDNNCPLPGAKIAFASAQVAYGAVGASDKLKMDIEPNQPHRAVPRQLAMAVEWFAKWL